MRMDRRAPSLDPERDEDELDQEPAAAAEPLDPAFVERIKESLADPRPDIPAEEVFAELRARHEARVKRGA
jgi:hypothetical protein